jgi:hypothetical protein
MRHPADAQPGGGREQRLGRRAEVRRAVVPENGQTGTGVAGVGVVDVQPPPIAQLQIGLGQHRPSIVSEDPPKKAGPLVRPPHAGAYLASASTRPAAAGC